YEVSLAGARRGCSTHRPSKRLTAMLGAKFDTDPGLTIGPRATFPRYASALRHPLVTCASSATRPCLAPARLVTTCRVLPVGLKLLEAVLLLQRTGGLLSAMEVVMNRRLRAVLAHKIHHKVNVIIASLRRAVVERCPPHRGLRPFRIIELHRRKKVSGDRSPLLVSERPFIGTQRQRAVPHVTACNLHAICALR